MSLGWTRSPAVMFVCLAVSVAMLLGCRSAAPIHVWQPANLVSVGSTDVVLTGLRGPQDIAQPLQEELLAEVQKRRSQRGPTRQAERISLITPAQLRSVADIESEQSIRLVSATDDDLSDVELSGSKNDQLMKEIASSGGDQQRSDLEVAALARRQGVRYLLRGEVVQATGRADEDQRLSVTWRLVGLTLDTQTKGLPVTVDQALVERKYPHLLSVTDPAQRLRQACIEESVGLLSATVDRQSVELAKPRLAFGSKAVRQGNELALAGNWPAAESSWMKVLKKHPRHPAAWINAAIAATARQDFDAANQRVTEAIRWSAFKPTHRSLAKETLVWIELRQRDYHEAFGLPEPPGGWRISQGPDSPRQTRPSLLTKE